MRVDSGNRAAQKGTQQMLLTIISANMGPLVMIGASGLAVLLLSGTRTN
jgi:hypothetical protein